MATNKSKRTRSEQTLETIAGIIAGIDLASPRLLSLRERERIVTEANIEGWNFDVQWDDEYYGENGWTRVTGVGLSPERLAQAVARADEIIAELREITRAERERIEDAVRAEEERDQEDN